MGVVEHIPLPTISTAEQDSWPYIPELLDKSVPRYTSYPPATQFHDGVGTAEYCTALEAVGPGALISLYIHIPYCHQICYYCGCNTGAANRKSRLDAYLDALEKEIETVGGILGGRAKVKRIAFGGGSPNAIDPVQFVRLLDRISTIFAAADPEISVELDPRSFSLTWALALNACNVKRVSLGVQTFAPHVQRAIGREQPFAMIEECVSALTMRGITKINFDLMYGLPEQSLDDIRDTIEKAVALGPSRVALFGYAHLPNMIPRQRQIKTASLPCMTLRFEQAQLGHRQLTNAGYQAIGFDHFATPQDSLAVALRSGTLHRNFQGFTDDDCDILIGFGASAIGQFPDLIVQNEKSVGGYRTSATSGKLATSRGYRKSSQDMSKSTMIEKLLCGAYIPSDCIQSKPELHQFLKAGILSRERDLVKISEKGRHYSRQIASALLGN